MINLPNSQKGLGIIGIVILIAFIFSLLNLYAFYNPNFTLSRFSPVNYFRSLQDQQRIKDLETLQKALIRYYGDHGEMPANDGWCGRMSAILHPELQYALKPYLKDGKILEDPTEANTDKDYFYYRYDADHYLLMAVLFFPKEDTKGKYNAVGDFSFHKCHDWPGDDVYNYQVGNLSN